MRRGFRLNERCLVAAMGACLATLTAGIAEGQSGAWSIGPNPSLQIGAGVRGPADQLGRVIAAQRLSDGSVAILDAMLPAVRVYDERGRHVRDLGRSGDGPGEFRVPLSLVVEGDTILVLDNHGRVIRFSAGGAALRTERTVVEGLFDVRFNGVHGGLLPDGSVLVLGRERLFGRVTGEYRQTIGLMRLPRASTPDTIGWFAADSIRTDREGVPVPRPYTPIGGLLWTATANRIFVVTADRPTLHSFAHDGSDARRVPIPLSPRSVTEADVEDSAAEVLRRAGTANDRRVIAEWVDGLPRSGTTPLVRSVVAGPQDEVWLESWTGTQGRTAWLVMTGVGVRARVAAPAGCRLLSVGGTWVLCLWRDEYDVEHVRLHTLRR